MNVRRSQLAFVIAMSAPAFAGCDSQLEEDEVPTPPPAIATLASAALGSGASDVGHYYQLRSVSSGLCADVNGKSTADGAAVLQYTCGTGENQRWYFRQLSSTTYQLSAEHSAKCLRVNGGSTSGGATIVQEPCALGGAGLAGTVFTATRVGTTSPAQYKLVSTNGGKCLQSPSSTVAAGLVQNTCSTSTKFLWTLPAVASVGQSNTNGRWSQVYDLGGVVAISAALTPSRKVIAWASWKGTRFGGTGSLDQTVTVLFDPAHPTTPVVKTVTNTAHNMFCPGTAMLADGRVLVNGGDDSRTDATSLYNPSTDTWSKGATMHQQRWYNVSVTLPDGRALTLGGNRTSGESGNGEIYDPAKNTWTMMDGIALSAVTDGTDPTINRSMEHPRLFVAPDGRIFVPGPTPHMQWYDLGGSGSVTAAGPRGDDEFSQNDVTVMYDVGKFLKAGGNVNYDRTNASFTPSSRNSYLIDINSGAAVVTKIAYMKYPRAFANGVVLPNGQVFINGGLDNGKGFSDDGAIRAAELFDPSTRTFRELPPMATSRPYHSWALLLADARVLVGGGGLCSSSDNCAVNHPNVEIYSPPYLFAGTRPTISSAPSKVTANGGSFSVSVSGTVTGFSLVRMGSVTHTVDTDQRFMRLGSSGGGGTFTVNAPANHNVAPPGYYLLFALNGNVPSVAKIVQIN